MCASGVYPNRTAHSGSIWAERHPHRNGRTASSERAALAEARTPDSTWSYALHCSARVLRVFHRVDNRRFQTHNWAARKCLRVPLRRNGSWSRSRQSLVTPIDWKLEFLVECWGCLQLRRQYLVTPIERKLVPAAHGDRIAEPASPFLGDAY